jgi:hypothetical protein
MGEGRAICRTVSSTITLPVCLKKRATSVSASPV